MGWILKYRIFWPELPWGQAMKERPEAKAEGSGYWRDNLIISSQGRRGWGWEESLEPGNVEKETNQDAEARSRSRSTRG